MTASTEVPQKFVVSHLREADFKSGRLCTLDYSHDCQNLEINFLAEFDTVEVDSK